MGCQDVEQSISVEEAISLISDFPRASGTETRLLSDALGRILAEDVVAYENVPAHASSAMDGYAFRHEDLRFEQLPLQARVAAGHPLREPLQPEHAVRIFTGGMIPAGADTVAMQEECEANDLFVKLPTSISVGANVRAAGDDIASGRVVLRAGARLRPQDVGVAAAVGQGSLLVQRRLSVGIVATGDELRAPGTPLPLGCIRDSNRHTIGAAVTALGAVVRDYGVVADRRDLIRDTLQRAAVENDLVISTGGVSVGDEDHVRPALEEIGSLDFWRLRIKPGRPIAVGDAMGTPFLGLPGNPVACLVSFWLVGRPLILHLMGATELDYFRYPVAAAFEHRRKPGRHEFLRGRLVSTPAGLGVSLYHSAGSGMLSSMTWSDGLVEIPEHVGAVQRGDPIAFVPYTSLL